MSTVKRIGRPPVTDDVMIRRMLKHCFKYGLSIRQACNEVGISHEAYYRRIRLDQDFADEMSAARQALVMSAKVNVYRSIASGDLATSKWLLDKTGYGDEVSHIVGLVRRLDKEDLNRLARVLQNDRNIAQLLGV